MAFRKDGGEELNGYLGPGSEIEGTVRFASVLRVDGKITGKVISEKELVVGEAGEVDAEVHVGSLSVSGKLAGKIHVSDRMEVHTGARVQAEVHLKAPHLIIEDGARFEGRILMGESAAVSGEPPVQAGKVQDLKLRGGAG